MGIAFNKTAAKPPTDRQPMCDNDILRLLADHCGHTIGAMVAHFHVTQTAIRARLLRLMLSQSVTRQRDDATRRRGRPRYLYFITSRGEAALAKPADEGTA